MYNKTAGEALFRHNDDSETKLNSNTENLLVNGDFSNGDVGWNLSVVAPAQATGSIVNGAYFASITNGGSESWHIQLSQSGLPLNNKTKYIVSFEA